MVISLLSHNPSVTHLLGVCLNLLISHCRPDILIKVSHSSEAYFVYGVPPEQSVSAINLSTIMIDYWVSFATSLDPNDGHGNPRRCLIDHSTLLLVVIRVLLGPQWHQYTPQNQVCFFLFFLFFFLNCFVLTPPYFHFK